MSCGPLWSSRPSPFLSREQRLMASSFLAPPLVILSSQLKSLDKRISKATKCLEKLPLLDDPQLSLGITRTCLAAPKLTYSLRTQPPSQPVAASLQVFDELLRDALSVIVGSPVPDLAWSQSSLPIKDGGLGVRQARDQHIPAFLGSSCQSAHLVSFLTECDITDTPEFLRASNDFREQSGSVNTPGFTQEAFQEKLDNATYNAFFSSLPDSREQARLQSLSLPYAGAWLTAVPIKGLGLHLLPAEFQAAVRYRLGLPVFASARRCPASRLAFWTSSGTTLSLVVGVVAGSPVTTDYRTLFSMLPRLPL